MSAIPPFNVAPRPAASSTADPISPISRSGTFPQKTSPAVTTQTPLINTSTRAINEEPVELDGGAVEIAVVNVGVRSESARSPGDEEDIDAEFLGEGKGGAAIAKRAAMLASRSKDPGVIVDVPKEPTAE